MVRIEIDQEYGVILAVETGQERLEATEISFPDSLPDPAWDGVWEEFQHPNDTPAIAPDVAEMPGYIKSLPPQSADPRRLRVFVSEIALEGAFPDYHQGQSVRLTLGISSLPAPLEGITTRRRGRVRNLGEETSPSADGIPQWPILLTGDGWTALAYTPIPTRGDTEIQGWFYYSAYGIVDIPTDLRVERIFAGIGTSGSDERLWQEVENTSLAYGSDKWWICDVVLDVTLDRVVHPPLKRKIFTGLDPVVSGHELWLRDVSLPVARCWETTTGRYLGQTLIPAPMQDLCHVLDLHIDDKLGAVAASGESGWILIPGQAVATKAPDWTPSTQLTDPPQVPSPWEVVAVRGEGLFELQSLVENSRRTALGRVNDNGGIDIGELPPSEYIIGPVVQIGGEYIVGRWVEEFRLNANLEIISTKELDIDEPGWESKGPIAYLWEDTRISFFDRTNGAELTSVGIAEEHQGKVMSATASEIIVLIYRRNPNGSSWFIPTAVASYNKGTWTTIPLQEAPAEMF
ncbi:ATP-binding protein [Corynebacterium glutamicum]|nr:ATP-binding protein [Corynebacterium glutamicum]